MFLYPKQTEFNRVLPKSKIYAHAKPGRKVKDLFVAQVAEIVWKYKLSPETINLPGRRGITEIQVFEIMLKVRDCHPAVIRTIDTAIPFPLIFQLIHEDHISFVASYKRPSEADSTKWVIEATFPTAWSPRLSFPLRPLPVALDLAVLHEEIVRAHIPIPARPGERIRDHVARCLTIESKQREADQVAARLAGEKQFNRKVELNAALRELHRELAVLRQ